MQGLDLAMRLLVGKSVNHHPHCSQAGYPLVKLQIEVGDFLQSDKWVEQLISPQVAEEVIETE